MSLAIELSLHNVLTGKGGPFGAVITRNNEIIATGYNQVTATNDPTAHAEIVAIRAACAQLQSFQLTNCIVYTSCEPCPMCLGAIFWSRPSQIYFANTQQDAAAIGFDDKSFYDQLLLNPELRTIPMKQIMREQALEAFRAWNMNTKKINY